MDTLKDKQALLYNVLAQGNQTTDIKRGLLHSIIVVEVYNNAPITIQDLEKQIDQKYGIKKKDGLLLEVNELKRLKRLEGAPTNKNLLYVTKDEASKLRSVIQRSHDEEIEFDAQFDNLLSDFKIQSSKNLRDDLIETYRQQYANDVKNTERIDGAKKFRQILSTHLSEENVLRFVDRLKEICGNNSYVNKTAATSTFLGLYHSKDFNNFISNKKRLIFLDTPVLVYMLCCFSNLQEDTGEDWDDPYYLASKSLFNLLEKHSDKVRLLTMEGYIEEVAGELKKAFMIDRVYKACGGKTSWGEINNTFYEYYNFMSAIMPDDSTIKSFDDFIRRLRLKLIPIDDPSFNEKEGTPLRNTMYAMDIEVVKPIKSDNTKKLETSYSWILQERGGVMKPSSSQKHDVQQVEYCATDDNFESQINTDRSIATWDFSLAELRNDFLEQVEKKDYSFFYVHNPAKQVNSISLATFDIDSTCITNDIFCYADERYNLSHKAKVCIEDLYPLIGNQSERTATFWNKLIDIQESELGTSSENDIRHDTGRNPIGEILMELVDSFNGNENLKFMTTLWRQYIEEAEDVQPLIDILSNAITAKNKSEAYDFVAQTILLLNKFDQDRKKENGN